MEYKYPNIKKVVAKTDFELFRDIGKDIRITTFPEGCQGKIELMGYNDDGVFYDIRFVSDDFNITARIPEDRMETYFDLY